MEGKHDREEPVSFKARISLPVVTHALTHGLSVLADLWVDPGDVILLPDKNWGNYNLIFSVRRGARIVQYPLFNDAWGFNLKAFEKSLAEEARDRNKVIVLLNFPNNPTGYTPTPEEAEGIVEVMAGIARAGTRVLAITDDAYFGLFYDDTALKESIFCRLLDRDPRLLAIKVDGATKENYVWG
jgi:aspartate/methionine/tyrosine aminotransferase